MRIQEVFNIYKEDHESYDYSPNGNDKNNPLLDIRESLGHFSKNDLELIKSYLSDNDNKWFVFYLLTIIKQSPPELFISILNSILSIGFDNCPSVLYDNIVRLYGFEKVELYLQNEFKNSYSDIYKKSIVEAMWRISYSIPFIVPDDDLDFITFRKYTWQNNSFQLLDFLPGSQEDAKLKLQNQNNIIQQRYKLVLEHFLNKNISPEFFHDCSIILPRKRNAYKNDNLSLFDSVVAKLKVLKDEKKSNFSIYLNNPVNNWQWI